MLDERPDRYYIPDNLNDKRRFLHIPDRNLIETAVAEFIVFNVLKIVPIPNFTVKIVAGAIIMILIGVVGLIGIKNESVSEFILTSIKFQKKKRVLHYRRCDQKKYDKENEKSDDAGRTESRAEELLKKIEDTAISKIESKIKEKNEKANR